jgi:hypothetical protein
MCAFTMGERTTRAKCGTMVVLIPAPAWTATWGAIAAPKSEGPYIIVAVLVEIPCGHSILYYLPLFLIFSVTKKIGCLKYSSFCWFVCVCVCVCVCVFSSSQYVNDINMMFSGLPLSVYGNLLRIQICVCLCVVCGAGIWPSG